MTEPELIKKIKALKEIRPRKDWVLLTKSQILGEEKSLELFPFFKPVYAGVFFLLILIGLFEFSQKALPGEPLFSLKRIMEKVQTVFVSEDERPKLNLELANKRLEELNEIAQKNEVKKLAPAINEFKADVSQAAKNLAKVKKVNKEMVAQAKKLEENKGKIEKVLATKIETGEYENAMSQLVEREIKDLEGRTLTEEQKEILAETKKDFEAGDYLEALTKLIIISELNYPQE